MFSQMNEEQFLRFIWLRVPDSDQLFFGPFSKQSSKVHYIRFFTFLYKIMTNKRDH